MRRLRYLGWLMVLALLCGPQGIQGQKVTGNEEKQIFFEDRASADAQREHLLRFSSLEDETDFWKDQQNFEKELKKISYSGYKAYIKGKNASYAEHKLLCSKECGHGTQYFRQASFYAGQSASSLYAQPITSSNTQKE